MNSAFIAGFLDELSKLGMEQFDERMRVLKKQYAGRLSDIFSKRVPARLEAAMDRRFPKVPSARPKPIVKAVAKTADFKDIVHHPITQTIGYAALAGEGVRRLAGDRSPQKTLHKSRLGRRIRLGTLGVGSAFLAAEALAALGAVFSKKKRKKSGQAAPSVIIKVQKSESSAPKIRMGRIPKLPMMRLGKLTKALGFKR